MPPGGAGFVRVGRRRSSVDATRTERLKSGATTSEGENHPRRAEILAPPNPAPQPRSEPHRNPGPLAHPEAIAHPEPPPHPEPLLRPVPLPHPESPPASWALTASSAPLLRPHLHLFFHPPVSVP